MDGIRRLDQSEVRNLCIVIRCSKPFKWRFRVAMGLMKIAGRIGGFKSITVKKSST